MKPQTLQQHRDRVKEIATLLKELKRLGREWDSIATRIEEEQREPTPAELERATAIRDRELAIKRTGLRLGIKWR